MKDNEVQSDLSPTQALPSLLTLYRRDLSYQMREDTNERIHACLEMPVRIACAMCVRYPALWRFALDFVQEGNIQLIKADRECGDDWSRQDFRNYVGVSVKGALYQYLQRTFDIRIPSTTRHKMIKKTQGVATIEWLEHHVAWERLLEHLVLFPEEDIPDRSNMHMALDKAKEKRVHDLLSQVSTQEREWICKWYGIGDEGNHTGREIAAQYGVCSDHVKRQINIAFKRIRGDTVQPTRESIDRGRTDRLQRIYEEHKGNIGSVKLSVLANCHTSKAATFLKQKEGRLD